MDTKLLSYILGLSLDFIDITVNRLNYLCNKREELNLIEKTEYNNILILRRHIQLNFSMDFDIIKITIRRLKKLLDKHTKDHKSQGIAIYIKFPIEYLSTEFCENKNEVSKDPSFTSIYLDFLE